MSCRLRRDNEFAGKPAGFRNPRQTLSQNAKRDVLLGQFLLLDLIKVAMPALED